MASAEDKVKKMLEQEEEGVNFKAVFSSYIRFWYLFFLTIPPAMVGAYYQNFKMIPKYTVVTEIFIQQTGKNTIMTDNMIPDMQFLLRPKKVNSEVQIFMSREICREAVRGLELSPSYYQIGNYKTKDLYTNCPFKVIIDSVPPNAYYSNFSVHILNANEFTLRYGMRGDTGFHAENHQFGEVIDDLGINFKIDKRLPEVLARYNDPAVQDNHRNFSFKFNFEEDMVRQYGGMVEAFEAQKKSSTVMLETIETVPERGVDFLNKMIEVYILHIIKAKKSLAKNMYDFIEKRLAINFKDLIDLELQIERFKRESNITDLDNEAKFILEGIKKFEIEQSDAETQLAQVRLLIEDFMRDDAQEISIPSTISGMTDHLLNQMIQKLNGKRSELTLVIQTVKPDNPLIVELRQQIQELKSALQINMISYERNLEIAVQDINHRIQTYKDQLKMLSSKIKNLAGLERKRNIKEELYLYLLQKKEEAAMALASKVIDCQLVQSAFSSPPFYKPNKSIIMIIGFVIGLVIPIVFITILNMMNDKIQNADFIKKKTLAPIIELIAKNKSNQLLMAGGPENHGHAERYKSLVFKLDQEEKRQSSLVVSCVHHEGKTFNAINIATTHASLGTKTLLIEMDLRNPTIEEKLNVPRDLGITDYLMEPADEEAEPVTLDQIVRQSNYNSKLYYIAAGRRSENPAELIFSEKLKALFNHLRSEYDKIIIDSPPIKAVSDAYIIGKLVDNTICVLRHNYSKKDHVGFINDLYEQGRFKNLGIIFNEAQQNVELQDMQYDASNKSKWKQIAVRLLRSLRLIK